MFIIRGVVPPFATGARKWGEFVSAGGSPNPELPSQRLAVPIPDAQIQRESSLTFVWVPRGLNARAAHLSHAAEGRQHPYAPRARAGSPTWTACGAPTRSTASRFGPRTGRFCSHFFHQEAEGTDALAGSESWEGEQLGPSPLPPGRRSGVAAARRSGTAHLPLRGGVRAIGPVAASPAVRDRLGL